MKYRQETFRTDPHWTANELMTQYQQWKDQLDLPSRPDENRRDSQALKGPGRIVNLSFMGGGTDRLVSQQPTVGGVVTMSPRLYGAMLREGHVSELQNMQIRIRRESWPHYLSRIGREIILRFRSP
jgi:hypothetical protein